MPRVLTRPLSTASPAPRLEDAGVPITGKGQLPSGRTLSVEQPGCARGRAAWARTPRGLLFRVIAAVSTGIHRLTGHKPFQATGVPVPRGISLRELSQAHLDMRTVTLDWLAEKGVDFKRASVDDMRRAGLHPSSLSFQQLSAAGFDMTSADLSFPKLWEAGVSMAGVPASALNIPPGTRLRDLIDAKVSLSTNDPSRALTPNILKSREIDVREVSLLEMANVGLDMKGYRFDDLVSQLDHRPSYVEPTLQEVAAGGADVEEAIAAARERTKPDPALFDFARLRAANVDFSGVDHARFAIPNGTSLRDLQRAKVSLAGLKLDSVSAGRISRDGMTYREMAALGLDLQRLKFYHVRGEGQSDFQQMYRANVDVEGTHLSWLAVSAGTTLQALLDAKVGLRGESVASLRKQGIDPGDMTDERLAQLVSASAKK